MLAKKSELLRGEAQKLEVLQPGMKGIVDDATFMRRLESLQEEAKAEDGWTKLLDEEKFVMIMKTLRPDETLMRGTLEIDLPAKHALLMMCHLGNERKEWHDECRSSEIVKELAPGDVVCKWEMNLNFAIKYVMSIPDKIAMRVITRENWPEQGQYGYAILPYDIEKETTLEELGPMKVKCGVIKPHPDDPENKSRITSLDSGNLKYVPTFVLKSMMKNVGMSKLLTMVAKYKKSTVYQQN